jgi:hypothetical protein
LWGRAFDPASLPRCNGKERTMRWIPYNDAVNELLSEERERLRSNPERMDEVVLEGFSGLRHMTLEGLAAEYEREFGEPVRVAFDRSSPGDAEDVG